MLLQARGGEPVHVPAYPVKVRDVSGAGDTVAAVLAVMLAMGADFESAMRAANAAAAVVVGKRGTATVSAAELRARILPSATLAPEEKIVFDWRELDERLDEWRAQDLRIGFTNGVFDLLHPGHVKVLAQARAACDRLVVGLNSDASVRRLKGKDAADPERARPRRGAGRARSGRSGRGVRAGHAARTDPPRAAERAGQGRRLPAATRWSAASWSRRRAARWCWSIWCRASARRGSSSGRGRASRAAAEDRSWPRNLPQDEAQRVHAFFGNSDKGFFCRGRRQSAPGRRPGRWSRAGWTGVLVEPQPDLAAFLVTARNAKVFAVACVAPDVAGHPLPLRVASPLASIDVGQPAGAPPPSYVVTVPTRTLDDILREAEAPAPLDLIVLDVYGHELDALLGFDFGRWRPRLIVIADPIVNLTPHRFPKESGYRLIRRVNGRGGTCRRTRPLQATAGQSCAIIIFCCRSGLSGTRYAGSMRALWRFRIELRSPARSRLPEPLGAFTVAVVLGAADVFETAWIERLKFASCEPAAPPDSGNAQCGDDESGHGEVLSKS